MGAHRGSAGVWVCAPSPADLGLIWIKDDRRMTDQPRTLIGFCPECDTRIRFHTQPRLGQLVTCHECGEISEVVELNPIELTWAYSDDEQYRQDSVNRSPKP